MPIIHRVLIGKEQICSDSNCKKSIPVGTECVKAHTQVSKGKYESKYYHVDCKIPKEF